MSVSTSYRPAPRITSLGDDQGAPFYDRVEAAEFPAHILRFRNQRWAARIGLGELTDEEWTRYFAAFAPLPDNLSSPIALRYHGHQFRNYNPDIGDGRGFLYAQLLDEKDRLLDLGTKGSGQTPYSRGGDGRLTLKGGVREVLATEMLEAAGVNTSKSLSLIETGEQLFRNDEPSPTRSSVLVRLSHSHIRFGSFQRLAYEKNDAAIDALVDYCIRHFYPALTTERGTNKVVQFYSSVVSRTARLAAQWMAAGFVHGVLNTDNMNITGESFDYGPWRFAPTADPSFTAAYFDQTGLYAFGRQAEACAWNLAQLGGALSSLASTEALTSALQSFSADYQEAMADAYFARLGLERKGEEDFLFVVDLLRWMTETGAPYEQCLFDWFCGPRSAARAKAGPLSALYQQPSFAPVEKKLLAYEARDAVRLEAPYFQREAPCTMLIDTVEALWAAIARDDDWSLFEKKLLEISEMRRAYALTDGA